MREPWARRAARWAESASFSQDRAFTLHVYPAGQQCWRSSQHTACEGQGGLHVSPPPPTSQPPRRTRFPCPGQAGGHSREATGSRPSPHSGWGSRSAPRGSWCAGHSPCLCGETGRPGGQASSPIQSPSCFPSDNGPRPSTCSHGGSNACGLSSRQPGGAGGSIRWPGKLLCGTEAEPLPTPTPSPAHSSSSWE